jgi:hypothetical protein
MVEDSKKANAAPTVELIAKYEPVIGVEVHGHRRAAGGLG